MRAFAIGLGLLAAGIAGSCVVSSFEKVDALDLPDSSTGGQDGGNSDGAGGQAGQVGQCAPGCPAGPNAEKPCCFVQSGAPPDECGYEIPEENDACWAPNQATTPETTCANSTHGTGCCLESGLCGYLDTAHGLGCVATEVYGDDPATCGDNPCGKYCMDAKQEPCGIIDPAAPFQAWDCGQRCKEGPCLTEIKAVLDSCTFNNACMDNGDPVYGGDAPGCPTSLFALAKCFETNDGFKPDCFLYCSMVTSACKEPSTLQYANVDDCLNLCGPFFGGAPALSIGSFNDGSATGNTLACRIKALGDATLSPLSIEQACAGAGPAGDYTSSGFSCGGGMCESYCKAFEFGCPAEYAIDYPVPGECLNDCNTQVPNPITFVWETSPINDNLACRLRESLQAFLEPGNPAHCQSAHITSPCPP